MSDNAELVLSASYWNTNRAVANPRGAYVMIRRLAAALEATDQRAKNAEQRADDAREEVGYEKRMREFVSGERDRFIDLKRDAERDRDLFKREQVRLAARCDQAQNERNEYAAVVEKVRAKAEEWQSLTGEGPRTVTRNLDGGIIEGILATAGADVLREAGPAAGCAYCVGAGGYEDYDGEWRECSCQRADREPSDAEVESAARALAEWDGADWHRPDPEFAAYWAIPKSAYRRGARLALIAAQEVRRG